MSDKRWWVQQLSNGLRLTDSVKKTLHVCFATKKDHELLSHIASTMNAVDEMKKFFDEAEHDSNCGGFKGWKCECWISKNKALFKTLEELNKLE